jgi:NAD(P)-dependent dehydrogenase (short-subunit alcohol dehydrogenase family)
MAQAARLRARWLAASLMSIGIVTKRRYAGQRAGRAARHAYLHGIAFRGPLHEPPLISRPPLRVAVTGGTSGLGLALVEAFAARGDAVAFVARMPTRWRASRRVAGSHGIVGDVARKDDAHAIALQVGAALGGLDVLVNNASSLGPVPLALLADTECEDFEAALATNLVGPFRLTKALLGALAGAAREGAAGAARSSQRLERRRGHAVRRLGRVRREQGGARAPEPDLGRGAAPHGVAVVAVDPGDMDTPLHALAVPDADPATLSGRRDAAREIVARIDRERRAARGRRRTRRAPWRVAHERA